MKKLRNVIGKCFMCSIFCMFMNDLLSILDKLNILGDFCSLAGYSKHFFKMASLLWLFVMSYQMWKGHKTVKDDAIRYRFLVYNIFAWSLAAIPTGLILLINHGWENDPYKWDWMPLMRSGLHGCTFFYRYCFSFSS
ncbi:probable G-protein coupled receptor Mth-like 7 [Drosophila takahashii]|uniref:probable G-protein coupled receptor Mth-like 7 n=1 Tax=Drosophila takahashii TaxID=29030 RepID=UPI0038996345